MPRSPVPRVVVIGADAAGMSAASQIKRHQPGWNVQAFEQSSYSSFSL
ncbi:MAG: hypothetical protein M1294_05650 [Firmicutes bacterium]|nr:hypothetical protein [Bacillota bacterium]MCL5013054.1 hypothetical protein [Bacillota bacterium]